MYLNKKGFTLVEIIVSIALASIILMLAGTLILSSTNLLNTSSERDLDKRTVDSVIEFVREEIEYATDVRIVESGNKYVPNLNDTNWHYFYIKDNKLYRDDKDVFSDGFYSGRNFNMTVKANYQNNTRVDIRYILNDGNEDTYTSRDTVMLLNLNVSDEMKKDGLYPSEYQQITETGYRIYYNKKYVAPASGEEPAVPDYELTGTVADIRYNISGGNYLGVWKSGRNYQTKNGEIVWHNGYWWEFVQYNDYREPGKQFAWKCLDMWYHPGSTYEYGDIVLYDNNNSQNTNNGAFYQYQFINESGEKTPLQYDAPLNNSKFWTKIGNYNANGVIEKVKEKRYPKKTVYRQNNVVDKYSEFLPQNFQLFDQYRSTLKAYNKNEIYNIYDIVKKVSDIDSSFYDIYMKIIETPLSFENLTVSSGWVKLDIFFDVNSSYATGDIVRYSGDSNPWIIAQRNILVTTNPAHDIYNNKYYWIKEG